MEDIQERKRKIDAGDVLVNYATEYGQHVISNLFPHAVDGLKKVHRRTLWTFFNYPSHYKVKGLALVGKITDIHPYGDAAISESIVYMSQPFTFNISLIKCEGDIGTYAGDKAGQFRYLEFSLPEITKDLFYNGIELKSFPMEYTETMDTMAPIYMIPKLPTALCLATTTIGYGYPSYTLAYPIESVADMVKSFIDQKKINQLQPWDYKKVLHAFIPHHPVETILRNSEDILNNIKDHNDFTTSPVMDGVLQISSLSPLVVHIHTAPHGIDFRSIQKLILDQLRKPGSTLSKYILDIIDSNNTKMQGNLVITFKRNSPIAEVLQELKRIIYNTGSMTVIPNYVLDNKIINLTPSNLLTIWHSQRYNSIILKKKMHQARLTHRLRVLEIKILVADKVKEVISIITNNDDESILRIFRDKYKLTLNQALILIKIPIGELSKTNKEECLKQLDATKKELKELMDSFSAVNDEIYADAEYFSKKYGNKEQGMRIPKYVGYIHVNDIYIQVESLVEMLSVLDNNKDALIYAYPKLKYIRGIRYKDRNYHVNVLPKYTDTSPHHVYAQSAYATFIMEIGEDGRQRTRYHKGYHNHPNAIYLPSKHAIVIEKNGTQRAVDITKEFGVRKSLNAVGTLTNISVVYPDNQFPVFVFSMNDTIPNTLRVQELKSKDDKLIITHTGNTYYLAVVSPIKYEWVCLNLEPTCINRCKIQHAIIKDITKLHDICKGRPFVDINIKQYAVGLQCLI